VRLGHGPMTPVPHRVVGRREETKDVMTLSVAPLADRPMVFRPGQFNMLTAFGVGEVAISVSSAPGEAGPLRHCLRDVGPVTHALCRARVGDLIGVRGPFGTDWGIGDLDRSGGGDIVVVAGGIGLAPLRGAVEQLVREGTGRIFLIIGAREPAQVIFADDLRAWAEAGAEVAVTVDVAPAGWGGHVGVVTSLLGGSRFDPARTDAMVCGPEIMMRLTARALIDRGVDPTRIRVSLERNMQCGVGWCGHCQLGPLLLCRDGPILPYAGAVAHLLTERER